MITNEQLANGRDWCVAGGWAACPQLATDQDVWIFAMGEPLDEVREDVFALGSPDIEHPAGEDLRAAYIAIGDWARTFRVGTIENRHIMVTDAKDVYELLNSFDISTHQCAILPDMQFIKGWQWTPIFMPPVQIKDTPSTNSRMAKITARYQNLRSV